MKNCTTTQRVHHVLQTHGIGFCPLKEQLDSDVRPPQRDETCPSEKKHGYNIYIDEQTKHVCVFYHTRCKCAFAMGLYKAQSYAHLQQWVEWIATIPGCEKAVVAFSPKGKPYIDTGSTNLSLPETDSFFFLSSPDIQISVHAIEEE